MTTYRTIVGLDIGIDSVKAARVTRRGRRWNVSQTEMLRLPPDSRGTPAPMIARWLQTNGLAGYPIALNLSGQAVMFQTIALRDEDPRSREQAAAVEVARFQEMSAEDTSHAVLEIQTFEKKRRLLLVIARTAMLETLLQTYRDQELNVVGMAPTTTAMFNFAAPLLSRHSQPYILADVGSARTDIGVALDQSLLFGRSFAGFRGPTGTNAPGAILERAAAAWVKDLQSSLSLYGNLYPQPEFKPTSIVLCGDACEAPGFLEAVAKLSDLEVFDLEDRLTSAYPKECRRFATAAGTAVSMFPSAAVSVDLLPPAAREELLLKTQKRYWAAAGVAGFLTFAILMVGAYRNAQRAQHHLEREARLAERIDQLARQIETQKRRGDLIFDMAAPLTELITNGTIAQDLLVAVANNLAPEDVITIIGDETFYFHRKPVGKPADGRNDRPAESRRDAISGNGGLYSHRGRRRGDPDTAAVTASDPKSAVQRVIIEGYTPHLDLSTVSALIARLREAPFVNERTDMLADDRLLEDHVWTNMPSILDMRRFVIDVHLNTPEADAL